MLIRTLRLTDKFSSAGLRLAAWASAALVSQLYQLRLALVATLMSLWYALTQTARTGQGIYQTTEDRRRDIMARRAAEAIDRPAVREDPLRTQNRALSLFTVLLLGSLIVLVLWFTGSQQINGSSAPRPGVLPVIVLSVTAKIAPPAFPTIEPTATPIPDPLRVGGSIVYALHENGYDNLWVIGIGQSTPLRLTNGAFDDRDPAWSHDGKRIAFASHRDGFWSLYVMEVATGKITRLTVPPGYERAPSWSPDDKFIAYEGYDGSNLDIWLVASDGSQPPQRLTQNAAPDFAPAWSPGGRTIAYVSLRDSSAANVGGPAIYVIDLNNLGNPTQDSNAQRLTNTPNVDEGAPTWSPDGQSIAYTARDNGGPQLVYVKSIAQPTADPIVIGQGHDPAWAPNSLSLLSAVDRNGVTTLIANSVGSFGVADITLALKTLASHPNWTAAALPASLLQNPPPSIPVAPPLFSDALPTPQPNPPFYQLAKVLPDVPNSDNALLSQTVADSFIRLRNAVQQRTGLDYLGGKIDLWWAISGRDRHIPDPGQPNPNWHYAGRSFDIDRNLVYSNNPDTPPALEVVRDDAADGNTYWRVYLRVSDKSQGGALGEPLKVRPWDFASRTSQDPQIFNNGGRLKASIPNGYYVDLTDLAADYGWQRIPADRSWRGLATGLLYWEFDRRNALKWNDAMLELYTQPDINAFLSGPTPVPTPVVPPTPVGSPRTPTPIPPDKLQ